MINYFPKCQFLNENKSSTYSYTKSDKSKSRKEINYFFRVFFQVQGKKSKEFDKKEKNARKMMNIKGESAEVAST